MIGTNVYILLLLNIIHNSKKLCESGFCVNLIDVGLYYVIFINNLKQKKLECLAGIKQCG